MRLSLLLFIIAAIVGCSERRGSGNTKEETVYNKCERIIFDDGSSINHNRFYFDTLNIDSISVIRKKISSSIVNGAFKGKFLFQDKKDYSLILDSTIIDSIYTKYKVSNTNPSAILIKQEGCQHAVNTSLSASELRKFENSNLVICSIYVFKVYCAEKIYNSLIVYRIENK